MLVRAIGITLALHRLCLYPSHPHPTQKKTFVKSIDTMYRVSYINGRVRSEPEKAPRRNTASRRCFFCGKVFLNCRDTAMPCPYNFGKIMIATNISDRPKQIARSPPPPHHPLHPAPPNSQQPSRHQEHFPSPRPHPRRKSFLNR